MSMLFALIFACTRPEPDRPADAPTATDTAPLVDTAPDPATTPTSPTSPTETGAPPTDGCDALPATATLVAEFPFTQAFEDFTFGADGYFWGVSLYVGELTRIPYGGDPEVLRTGVTGYARGTRFLPDGDLVSVDYGNNAIKRIDVDTGGDTLLTASLTTPNGIAVGDDGFVYLSQNSGEVLRIDPVTGESELLATSPVSNDGISFSPDYRTLYLNSDQTSDYLQIGVDVDGQPTTDLQVLAQLPGVADGMVVDACGNAYVTQFDPPGLVRVRPDGTVEPFLTLPAGALPVSANFGSGIGGWTATHLFVSDWNAGVTEWDAGVAGKWEPHLP